MTSAATPSPTLAANPPLGSLRITRAATTTTSAPATRTASTASSRLVAPIRVVNNANGTVTVTNVTNAPPLVIKNK
jgi:hypothetical protein